MNELKDNDICEALRRMEARRTPAKVPFDFSDKVMQEIEPKRKRRGKYVAAFLAIAASVSLAILMVLPHKSNEQQPSMTDEVTVVTQPHQAETIHPNDSLPSLKEIKVEKITAKREVKKKKANDGRNTIATTDNIADKTVATASSDIDSLEYFIDKIEQELAHVDESLYIERINKVIQADDRLQRIVDQYILRRIVSDDKPQTVQMSNPQNINHYEE